jgi:hypothetical protein
MASIAAALTGWLSTTVSWLSARSLQGVGGVAPSLPSWSTARRLGEISQVPSLVNCFEENHP